MFTVAENFPGFRAPLCVSKIIRIAEQDAICSPLPRWKKPTMPAMQIGSTSVSLGVPPTQRLKFLVYDDQAVA